jgi:hypothetical protein
LLHRLYCLFNLQQESEQAFPFLPVSTFALSNQGIFILVIITVVFVVAVVFSINLLLWLLAFLFFF